MLRLNMSVVATALGVLLAGCMTPAATYQGPSAADESAATIIAGTVAESYSVSQGSSAIQITAVDGEPSGLAPLVRVTAGEHKITVRHFDGYANIYANVDHESVTFQAEPGGRYRIDASYCCGYILGQFDIVVVDEATGRQVAELQTVAQ